MDRNNVVLNGASESKIRFNDMLVELSSTEKMLKDVTPFEWSQDVISGKAKATIRVMQDKEDTSMEDMFKEIICRDGFYSRKSKIAAAKRYCFCINNICKNTDMSITQVLDVLQISPAQYKEYGELSGEDMSFHTFYNEYADANVLISSVDALSNAMDISIKDASEIVGSSLGTYDEKCRFLDEIDLHKDEILFPDKEITIFFEERKGCAE